MNRHQNLHRVASRAGSACLRAGVVWTSIFLLLSPSAVDGGNLSAVIDFEDQRAGTQVSTLDASSDQGAVGPILVHGFLPSRPGVNSALIFDSARPSGGDFDLGTPNQSFGGPGIGSGGEAGMRFENSEPLGQVLIMAENLVDADGDGLIDDPDDDGELGMLFTIDFTGIQQPVSLGAATVLGITVLDIEATEPLGAVRLFDADGEILTVVSLPVTGNNGVGVLTFGEPDVGIPGVARLEVELNGSGAVAEIRIGFPLPPPPDSLSFIRGDANADGGFDISDPIVLLHFLFGDGTVPCVAALDVNDDDATIGLADAIFAVSSLVGLGPIPPLPFADCGPDPSRAGFECASFPPCP